MLPTLGAEKSGIADGDAAKHAIDGHTTVPTAKGSTITEALTMPTSSLVTRQVHKEQHEQVVDHDA